MGHWIDGAGTQHVLINPSTEEPLAEASSAGLDVRQGLAFARRAGGAALREMTFVERAQMIERSAKVIFEHREELIELAMRNGGCARADAELDVDGASATLAAYAMLGKQLADSAFLPDGEAMQLAYSPEWIGRHILVPRQGVALQINAFNFPAWAFAEKAAAALLAGVPVVVKPAVSTALLTVRLIELLVRHADLGGGVLSLIAGSVVEALNELTNQDVVAFTGSSETASTLRRHPRLIAEGVRLNIEADSINAAVLGDDVTPGGRLYEHFIAEMAHEITIRSGQRCTAARRIFVPLSISSQVERDLSERLSRVILGDPAEAQVTMGPLVTRAQLEHVRAGVTELKGVARMAFQGDLPARNSRGFFHAPTLLFASDPTASTIHEHEVFGPVATLVPYRSSEEMISGVIRGHGGLVASLYTDDATQSRRFALGLAPFHGRLHLAGQDAIGVGTPPGMVMPFLIHGGPGRAGGGEELGGLRAMALYSQRTAIQSSRRLLESALASGAR